MKTVKDILETRDLRSITEREKILLKCWADSI